MGRADKESLPVEKDGLGPVAVVRVEVPEGDPLCAEVAPAPVFDVPQVGVAFATGDTWTQNGQTMRLYGVQSCIRGTTFTNPLGVKTDCGEASLAYLAAVIRDTRPQCAPVAQIGEQRAILVVCSAHVGSSTLDLGTVLITEGFAFAAFTNDAKPVYMPYLVAELVDRAPFKP